MSMPDEYGSAGRGGAAYHTYRVPRPDHRSDALEPPSLRRRYPPAQAVPQRMSYVTQNEKQQRRAAIDIQAGLDYPSRYAPADNDGQGAAPSHRYQPAQPGVHFEPQSTQRAPPTDRPTYYARGPSKYRTRPSSSTRPTLRIHQDTLPRVPSLSPIPAYPIDPSHVVPRRQEGNHRYDAAPSPVTPVIAERPPNLPSKPRGDRTDVGKHPRQPETELLPEPRDAVRAEERSARERREVRRSPKEAAMKLDEMEADLSCPICMSVMVAAHAISPCGHTLCAGCAYEWIRENQTCAICRQPLTAAQGLIPVHALDALIERWVAKKGTTWDGLAEYTERKEIWESQRSFLREEDAARGSAATRPRPVSPPDFDDAMLRDMIWSDHNDLHVPTMAPLSSLFRHAFAENLARPAVELQRGRQPIPDSAFTEMLSYFDRLQEREDAAMRANRYAPERSRHFSPRDDETHYYIQPRRVAELEDGMARLFSRLRERPSWFR